MRRAATSMIFAACVGLFATPAAAQDDDTARARAHFQQGIDLIQRGRWAEAVSELEAARDLRATAPVLFNLGIALRGVGRARDAIATFERFLEELGPSGAAERRAEVEGYVRELEATLAHVEISVTPESARVSIDGTPLAAGAREVVLDPGEHRVTATAPRYARYARSLSVDAGERTTLTVTMDRAPPRLRVDTAVADAVVYVDGEQVGVGVVERELDPGEHVVEVRAPGHDAFRRTVTLELGQDFRLEPDFDQGGEVWESPWLWVGLGAAVVAGVVLSIVLVAVSGTESPYVGDLGLVTGVLTGP